MLSSYIELRDLVSSYLSQTELDFLDRAYHLAFKAHGAQCRHSGEPYIEHPIAVASILAQYQHVNIEILVAALLHDVLEDTCYQREEMLHDFGEKITHLVEGVSKLRYQSHDNRLQQQFQNLLKMLKATTADHRVLAIKLADRLHNMRTIAHLPAHKKQRKAQETLEVYGPLAGHLGMFALKTELESLAFECLYPYRFSVLKKFIQHSSEEFRPSCEKIIAKIDQAKYTVGLSSLEIFLDHKHPYELYLDHKNTKVPFQSLPDLVSLRCLVQSVQQCYTLLGLIHHLYPPFFEAFRDYIGLPKMNAYKALHTAIRSTEGLRLSIVIQTKEMYKIGLEGWHHEPVDQHSDIEPKDWTYSLDQWQGDESLTRDGLEAFKEEISKKQIVVFDKEYQRWGLPQGSTALDFAYNLEPTKVPYYFEALINGYHVSLGTVLKNGDTVDFLQDDRLHIHPGWINFAATVKAKALVKTFIQKQRSYKAQHLGEKIFASYRSVDSSISTESRKIVEEMLAQALSPEVFYEQIGLDKIQFTPQIQGDQSKEIPSIFCGDLVLKREDLRYLTIASLCCHPYNHHHVYLVPCPYGPWQIHTKDCAIYQKGLKEKLFLKKFSVAWIESRINSCKIILMIDDQIGSLATITHVFAQREIQILALDTLSRPHPAYTAIEIQFYCKDSHAIPALLQELKRLPAVMSLRRSHHDS